MKKVRGVTSDSRLVKEGFMFVAIKGLTEDGHDFIPDAIKNGAIVIVGEKDLKVPSGIKYVKVADSRDAIGKYASEFYGDPSNKLKVIGVTGTKGKTTTVHIIYHILSSLGKKVGMVSSIAAKVGNKEFDTGFHVTSPDCLTLQKLLADMVKAGCEYAVIEVSSHGIKQKRIAGVNFDTAVLTNIAPEHLDYHKTFEEYKKVKMSFINSAKNKVICPPKTDINILPGLFNNLNAEAAIRALSFYGIDKNEAVSTLDSFRLPAGRLEETENEGVKIFIDFAHTPNSLEAALTYLRTKTKRKLISVFGCAGERDKRKRFQMGKISVSLADFSVFTAEDPRREDLGVILGRVSKGAKSVGAKEGQNFVRIYERGEAIAYALSIAKKGDVIGIFGKGHEKSLAYGSESFGKVFEHPWSDQEAVENYITSDKSITAIVLAAGKGTRMHSSLPKVLHEICGRPMISYTLQNLRRSGVSEIITVVSFKKNLVIRKISGAVKIAVQKNPKGGTADAAKAGFAFVPDGTRTLIVINGDDSAFYTPGTIKNILKIHSQRERKLTFVSLMKDNPTGLGRVIRGESGLITKIVEEKDATAEERKIKEVNDGLYVFDKAWFSQNIGKVKISPQGEYYLVDLIKIAIDQGDRMATYTLPNDDEWQGINTSEELEKARSKMVKRIEALNE